MKKQQKVSIHGMRYEQLRDDILMLYDYAQAYGMEGLSGYKVRYEEAGSNCLDLL